jgi:hypothetical protein
VELFNDNSRWDVQAPVAMTIGQSSNGVVNDKGGNVTLSGQGNMLIAADLYTCKLSGNPLPFPLAQET